jgi:flagellin-like hook-associated protein FlgL
MADISISAGMRSSLASLQKTAGLLNSTQSKLATGKKVNSAVDNPTNFFAAANLNDRADKLNSRLDGMGQAVSTLKAADNGITAMRGIVSALKGVVDEALAASASSDRATLGKQFNELLVQLNDFSKDASYKGVNLLQSNQADATAGGNETLTVQFNEAFDESTLAINGVNIRGNDSIAVDANGEIASASNMSGANSSGFAISFNEDGSSINGTADVIGIRSAEITEASESSTANGVGSAGQTLNSAITWTDDATYQTNLKSVVSDLEAFDTALINTAKSLSQNVNIVSLRQDFTSGLVGTLQEGADKLTLADLNEEGANLLALQTSQTLGIQSLSLASQSNQAVLSLLG